MALLVRLQRSITLQQTLGLIAAQSTSLCCPRRLFSISGRDNEPDITLNPENPSLLKNLNILGVDVKMARQRQPGVLRKVFTNEQGLCQFLQSKGASRKVIASIISRYPRAITRSIEHLEQRWRLWKNVFETDAKIVAIMERSPESFFRSSDNGNLEKNIAFLSSLGLNTKDLHRLLTTAPRTFSNSFELNKQMVAFLEDVCMELGGRNPEQFARAVISRNLYIFIRSTKRVRANIDNLKTYLKMSNFELLSLIQGPGAEVLDLSNEYLKKNFSSLQQKMISLGCCKADVKKLVTRYPMVLYIGPETLSSKVDCLLKGGITIKQVLERPKVLEYSIQNITGRLEELQGIGYDFQTNGIGILDLSRKRYETKLEKLVASSPEEWMWLPVWWCSAMFDPSALNQG